MKPIRMVDLQGQYLKIKNEIDSVIQEVINSTAFINGPEVKKFQSDLQKYLEVNEVITCANGTDALQAALMALELKPGDEVITPSFTFIATVEVIALLGLKPVFVDVNPKTFNIDLNDVERKITGKTKAIIPVHLFGLCCEMDSILEIAEKNNLYIIEDAAQALGSIYTFKDKSRKKAGSIGHIGCTSFFPSKNLGCFGDGGAIFTDDTVLGDKIKSIVNHGSKIKYYHDYIGINSRLDTLQAAILTVKLKNLDRYNLNRQKAADFYNNAFRNNPDIEIPFKSEHSTHIYHQYTIQVKPGIRNKLSEYLNTKNIPSMVYYPVPLHLQNAFRFLGCKEGDLPVSESLSKSVLSLPMHTELDDTQLNYITTSVQEFFN